MHQGTCFRINHHTRMRERMPDDAATAGLRCEVSTTVVTLRVCLLRPILRLFWCLVSCQGDLLLKKVSESRFTRSRLCWDVAVFAPATLALTFLLHRRYFDILVSEVTRLFFQCFESWCIPAAMSKKHRQATGKVGVPSAMSSNSFARPKRWRCGGNI